MADASSDGQSNEHVRDAVLALINAQTWVASRGVMRAKQESLFAPFAKDVFAELLRMNQDDSAAVQFLTRLRTLLAQAKASGIDAAYANLITPAYVSSLQHEMQTLAYGEPRRVEVARALLMVTDDENRVQRARLGYELATSLLNDKGDRRAQSLTEAAACLRDAIGIIARDDDPELRARLQIGLADTLLQFAGRADLAGDAIEHYEAALPYWSGADPKLGRAIEQRIAVLRMARANREHDLEAGLEDLLRASTLMRREDDPEQWARLQHNLGETYRLRAAASGSAPEMERAIEYFERALEVFTATAYPVDFGLAANSLGAAYLERSDGERSENIERAVGLLDAALAVRPREKYPDYWAKTHVNLGNAYLARVAGERSDNVEAAIGHLQAPFDGPLSPWVAAQRGGIERQLAQAYLERSSGEQPENLNRALQHARKAVETLDAGDAADELALAHRLVGTALARRQPRSDEETDEAIANLEQGLAVRVANERALDRAQAEQELAILFEHRTAANQAANLLKAIAHYEAARDEYERGGVLAAAATCDYWIGSVLRKRPDLPKQTRLASAIEQFRIALERFPDDGPAMLRADIHLEMGNALADLASGDRGASLQAAIAHYEAALRDFAPDELRRADVHSALGVALLEWSGGDRTANLESAIEHQRAVLATVTREGNPRDWALAHHNLGNVYVERTLGDPVRNIEDAIDNFDAALQVFTRDEMPEEWAMTHTSLGSAYTLRAGGDRSDNLEKAIGHYEDALKVYTQDKFPADWAMVIHNLANAYMQRIAGYEPENIERAIRAFEQSLIYRTREALPFFWAMTQVNLGNAYTHREYGERADNQRAAVQHYRLALDVYTKDSSPTNWAWAQFMIGSVLSSAALGVDERIEALRSALTVYTRDDHPQRWALAHNNLALAYREKSRTDPSAAQEAIAHLEQALQELTPEAFPRECRAARINLAEQYLLARDWSAALQWFDRAIEVGETILAAAYTEQGRLEESSTTGHLYTYSAYCLLQLGDTEQCIVRIDAGRTRQLAESLARGIADMRRLPIELRERLQKAREELRVVEAEMRLRDEDLPSAPGVNISQLRELFPDAPRTEVSGLTLYSLSMRQARIALGAQGLRLSFVPRAREARQALDAVVREALAVDPECMHAGIEPSDAISLVPSGGALVAFMLTPAGSAALVIPSGATRVDATHALTLGDEAFDAITELLNGTPEKAGWLRAYYDSRDEADTATWQEVIASATRALWDVVMGRIQARLQGLGLAQGSPVILMPQSMLALLPLHAAWRDVGAARRSFVDDYAVTYAPSLYASKAALRQLAEPARAQKQLLLVVNPTLDLPYAAMEGDAVASHFTSDATRVLSREEATEAAVVAAVRGSTYLHFATHGTYDWRDVMRSHLSLAQSSRLTLGRVTSTDFDLDSARLVVLSACETGFTEFQRAPDEFLGLPAGFMEGGAPGIVSALWSINDLSTALLFEEFYRRHLGQGEDVATALGGAQRWLRDSTAQDLHLADRWQQMHDSEDVPNPYAYRMMRYYRANPTTIPYAAPYYWAAFTFYGAS